MEKTIETPISGRISKLVALEEMKNGILWVENKEVVELAKNQKNFVGYLVTTELFSGTVILKFRKMELAVKDVSKDRVLFEIIRVESKEELKERISIALVEDEYYVTRAIAELVATKNTVYDKAKTIILTKRKIEYNDEDDDNDDEYGLIETTVYTLIVLKEKLEYKEIIEKTLKNGGYAYFLVLPS